MKEENRKAQFTIYKEYKPDTPILDQIYADSNNRIIQQLETDYEFKYVLKEEEYKKLQLELCSIYLSKDTEVAKIQIEEHTHNNLKYRFELSTQ